MNLGDIKMILYGADLRRYGLDISDFCCTWLEHTLQLYVVRLLLDFVTNYIWHFSQANNVFCCVTLWLNSIHFDYMHVSRCGRVVIPLDSGTKGPRFNPVSFPIYFQIDKNGWLSLRH